MSAVTEVLAPRAQVAARRGVVRSLARVEARRLLLHPLVLVGLAMTALLTWQVRDEDSLGYVLLMGAGVLPLAIGVLLASNAAALRPRRDDAEELYATLPAPASARTLALLAAVGVAAVGSAAVALAQATVLGAWGGLDVTYAGQIETPRLVHLVEGPLLVAFFGALGVALARLVPLLITATLGVLVLLASISIVGWGPETGWRWLFPPVNGAVAPGGVEGWPCDRADPSWCPARVTFDDGNMLWHALYLVALTGLAGGIALLRDERTPARVLAVAACGVVAVALGAIQVA